nr:aldo/keto reductase [Lysobacter enzymogenes]
MRGIRWRPTRSNCRRCTCRRSTTAPWSNARRCGCGRCCGRRWPAAACSAAATSAPNACALLADLGRRHGGASVATMAYAWLLRHPTRPWPITGSGREQGLRDAVDALRIELSAQDWYEVWQASAGREVA